MKLDDYQKQALTFAFDDKNGDFYMFMHRILGLAGEAGELTDKVKKIVRDHGGSLNENDKRELQKELGDVLWYVAALADYFDTSMSEIAKENIEKLSSRKTRNKLSGSGDNR